MPEGEAARALFRRLYLALSPAAEAEIAATLEDLAGPLPARTGESDSRINSLR